VPQLEFAWQSRPCSVGPEQFSTILLQHLAAPPLAVPQSLVQPDAPRQHMPAGQRTVMV